MYAVRKQSYAEELTIHTDKWNRKYSVITLIVLTESQNIIIKGDILGSLTLIANSLSFYWDKILVGQFSLKSLRTAVAEPEVLQFTYTFFFFLAERDQSLSDLGISQSIFISILDFLVTVYYSLSSCWNSSQTYNHIGK